MTKKKETKEDKRIRERVNEESSRTVYMLESMMRGMTESGHINRL